MLCFALFARNLGGLNMPGNVLRERLPGILQQQQQGVEWQTCHDEHLFEQRRRANPHKNTVQA